MNLYEKIRAFYPQLDVSDFMPGSGTISVVDFGDGPIIEKWEHPSLPQPTEQELDEVVPVPTEPYIPQSVTPVQGLMALYVLKGLTEDDVLAAIGTIEDATLRYQAQIAYRKATIWDRNSVSMQTVAQLMALTESDLDELFTLAATYTNL